MVNYFFCFTSSNKNYDKSFDVLYKKKSGGQLKCSLRLEISTNFTFELPYRSLQLPASCILVAKSEKYLSHLIFLYSLLIFNRVNCHENGTDYPIYVLRKIIYNNNVASQESARIDARPDRV